MSAAVTKSSRDTRLPGAAGRAFLVGQPVRLAGAFYALYGKDPPVARIHMLLDDLETKMV